MRCATSEGYASRAAAGGAAGGRARARYGPDGAVLCLGVHRSSSWTRLPCPFCGASFDTFDKTVGAVVLPGLLRRLKEFSQRAQRCVRSGASSSFLLVDRPVADRQAELKALSVLRAVTGAVFGPLSLPVAVGKPVELPHVKFLNRVTCSSFADW